MKKWFLGTSFLFALGCVSAQRQPASINGKPQIAEPPPSAFLLEAALKQSPETTLSTLKSQLSSSPLPCTHSKDPAECLPSSLRLERGNPLSNADREAVLRSIRKYRVMAFSQRATQAQRLLTEFKCDTSSEAHGLALILERDFPNPQATQLAESLHDHVIACDSPHKPESLIRMTVFSIQKSQCPQALEYAKRFPPSDEQGVNDRMSYLQSFCNPQQSVEKRNPWGGYGIRLSDVQVPISEKPRWFLTTSSGSAEWDQLLATFIELHQTGHKAKITYLASKLNYQTFRKLPHSFQASILTVLHFSGADLMVFQTLHRYLAENPELSTKEVVNLLFPARFWKTIVDHSHGVDPLLVKSLIRQESAFNPSAISRARAMGLMQVIFPTARALGVPNRQKLLEPETNIRVGSEFLRKLIADFGSVELALAAYNAGPQMVKDWQRRYPTANVDLFVEMIPFSETREYVRLVLRNYKIYQKVLSETQDSPQLVQAQVHHSHRP